MSNLEIRRQLGIDAGEMPQKFVIKRTGIYASSQDGHKEAAPKVCFVAPQGESYPCTPFPTLNYDI